MEATNTPLSVHLFLLELLTHTALCHSSALETLNAGFHRYYYNFILCVWALYPNFCQCVHTHVCVCAREHVHQGLILSFDILTAPRDYVVH